jgi:UDP-N-acetylglucosamine diphosphorylase/glucosamine-1-phosphate N-acetyltransferase
MQINLFDQKQIRENLLPFTFTRPVACIRIGILTIQEKWEKYGFEVGFETQGYLKAKYALLPEAVRVNGALCPNQGLVAAIKSLKTNEQLIAGSTQLAVNGNGAIEKVFEGDFRLLEQPWHIFLHNKEQIEADFKLITAGRKSQPITDQHTVVYGKENLFLEEGATIKAAIINAEHGPVYIGKNAQVHEGAIIHGAFALCEGSHVNMGAKIKGDSTVGPFSKVGGEVSNSVIFGYSNKGHDGFLGNSVIGEWCNLGADTNTSNLKNNYAHVKLWSYSTQRFAQTGLQFCGLMMADHAKCGINTMFNTGTVVGVGANVFGAGFPKNFIPSFSWGGANGLITFQTKKFYEVAEAVMKRRGIEFSSVEKEIVDQVFELTAQYRTWDKA